MKRVTGIGGIFFKCQDPAKIRDWYKDHLGLNMSPYGSKFEWLQEGDPTKKGLTLWSPFPDNTKKMEPSSKDFMMNYRVENLEALIEELKKEGVTVLGAVEAYEGFGKFAHIMDPEGNKIELWEPSE